ncbi:MAG: chromosomal replication initiator protein DnaA [SAR202 cluster bacterium]|nr:chromosomal replication initiator protein DnaA [SAR202 cluster bacterium]
MATVIDASSLWQSVLGDLQVRINRPSYDTWLSDTHGLRHGNGQLIVETPNSFVCSMLEKRMYSMIAESVERVFGEPLEIIFKIASLENSIAADEGPGHIPEIIPDNKVTVSASPSNNGIIRRYTFDSFILGKSNELAYAASQAVSSNPGNTYNPLFIYAKVGLGKTHLLHAIGNELLSVGKNIHYTTTEEFTNEYIDAIRNGKTENFRNRYRHVDTLLLDDIQFLIGKEQTQEGFFHTFNTLHLSGRQLVISSDRPPKELTLLEDRIQSRLQGGLTVDIQPPDYETRLLILKEKASKTGFVFTEEILEFLSERLYNNIRELEGTLNRVGAYAQLLNEGISLELVKRVISDSTNKKTNSKASDQKILHSVSNYFNLDESEIIGKKRDSKTALVRQICMYLMREEAELSYTSIGAILGNRDHTTIAHAWKKIRTLLNEDIKVRRDIINIVQSIHS